jgi:hypothetical protein
MGGALALSPQFSSTAKSRSTAFRVCGSRTVISFTSLGISTRTFSDEEFLICIGIVPDLSVTVLFPCRVQDRYPDDRSAF